jgi:hypothetical protein
MSLVRHAIRDKHCVLQKRSKKLERDEIGWEEIAWKEERDPSSSIVDASKKHRVSFSDLSTSFQIRTNCAIFQTQRQSQIKL